VGRKTPSLEDLSAVIAAIHDTALDSPDWTAALQRISSLFDSLNATVWMQDPSGGFLDIRMLPADESTRDYAEYYVHMDKLRPAVMGAPEGTILTNTMVIPRSEFVRTEFHADFADRHDMYDCMQARVLDGPGWSGFVAMTSTNRMGAFEHEHVRLLRLLLPHLRGAQRTHQHLAFAAVERESALAALDGLSQGVLIVDAEARVLHANPAAEALLRLRDGLATARGGRLHAARPADNAALGRALAGAATSGGDTLAVARPSSRASFAVTVQPAALARPWEAAPWPMAQTPAALVFVVDPDRADAVPDRALRVLYGLTAAEAAVAGRIAQGQGVADAADALGVAASTLRWHLQRVFEKTGTARQAELARLVERLGTLGGNEDRG